MDPFLCWCRVEVETAEHIFCDCEWVRRVWELSPITVSFNSRLMEEWKGQNMKRFDDETFCIFTTVIWTIWFPRSRLVFQGKNVSEEEVVNFAVDHRRDFLNPMPKGSERGKVLGGGVKWKSPELGRLKLNMNASIKAGCGANIGGGGRVSVILLAVWGGTLVRDMDRRMNYLQPRHKFPSQKSMFLRKIQL